MKNSKEAAGLPSFFGTAKMREDCLASALDVFLTFLRDSSCVA